MRSTATPNRYPGSVIGYVRVSTGDQLLSLDAQRAALKRWCATHGRRLLRAFTDRGVSGGAVLERRPGLLAIAVSRGRESWSWKEGPVPSALPGRRLPSLGQPSARTCRLASTSARSAAVTASALPKCSHRSGSGNTVYW